MQKKAPLIHTKTNEWNGMHRQKEERSRGVGSGEAGASGLDLQMISSDVLVRSL
jgi:hypothetical protein